MTKRSAGTTGRAKRPLTAEQQTRKRDNITSAAMKSYYSTPSKKKLNANGTVKGSKNRSRA